MNSPLWYYGANRDNILQIIGREDAPQEWTDSLIAVFGNLVLCFADGCQGGQALGHGVAVDLLGELEMIQAANPAD